MLKLILADNQAIFRAGIAKVLAVEDEMRIVAQAQTAEQMFMALDKFRAAVLIIAGGFHSDFNSVLSAATKTRPAWSSSPTPARARNATWRQALMAWSIATSPVPRSWTACARSRVAKTGCRTWRCRAS